MITAKSEKRLSGLYTKLSQNPERNAQRLPRCYLEALLAGRAIANSMRMSEHELSCLLYLGNMQIFQGFEPEFIDYNAVTKGTNLTQNQVSLAMTCLEDRGMALKHPKIKCKPRLIQLTAAGRRLYERIKPI